MPVINDDRRTGNLKNIESGRNFVHLGGEGFQAQPNLLGRQAQCPASGRGGQHIFNLEADPAGKRQRNAVER